MIQERTNSLHPKGSCLITPTVALNVSLPLAGPAHILSTGWGKSGEDVGREGPFDKYRRPVGPSIL